MTAVESRSRLGRQRAMAILPKSTCGAPARSAGRSVLLLNPGRQGNSLGDPPTHLLLMAGLAKTSGCDVHLIDYNVRRLDFGIFNDVLVTRAPDWVVFHVECDQAMEAYRLAR